MTDYDTLEDIGGIGPSIAENLRDAGFDSPDAVMSADPDELAEVALLGDSSARAILDEEAGGRRGRDPDVEEKLEDIREHLEKPLSDSAAIAQSPIARSTHLEWLSKEGEPFESYQEMYAEARAIAEEKLIVAGLEGDFDSSLVKFLLKATFDYEDRTTHEVEAEVDQTTTHELGEEEREMALETIRQLQEKQSA